MRVLIVGILALLFFGTSCSDELARGFKALPNAFGEINQIVIVTDDEMWESPVGDTIRYYFAAAYPILPQPEPIYDLIQFTPLELDIEPARKEFRNYIVVANLSDESSETTQMMINDLGREKINDLKSNSKMNSTVGRDKWAKGQQLIYQFAFNDDELIDYLKSNFKAISKRIDNSNENKIESTVFQSGTDFGIIRKLEDSLSVSLKIPNDYNEALIESEDGFAWLRFDTEDIISNILIYKVDYVDRSQLTPEGIKAIRDSLGRKYVASEIEGTYMKINDIDLPLVTSNLNINGYFSIEARGIWEIENDYMGGPFLSYLLHNPDTNELLFLDGFIYAPGKEKRNYMLFLEQILKSVNFGTDRPVKG